LKRGAGVPAEVKALNRGACPDRLTLAYCAPMTTSAFDEAFEKVKNLAAANYKNLGQGSSSPKEIVTLVLGCVVLAGFLFLDWRALL
jgi:hypothetical protein